MKQVKRKSVAEGAMRAPRAPSPDGLDVWLDELWMWASAYLREDPKRPGAAFLKKAQRLVGEARTALASGDAERAAWAAMTVVDSMWLAQTLDAQVMIRVGVKYYRSQEDANADRRERANVKHAAWRAAAAKLRENPQHAAKSKSDIARLIDLENWNEIRKHI